jgi:hypothetical protein
VDYISVYEYTRVLQGVSFSLWVPRRLYFLISGAPEAPFFYLWVRATSPGRGLQPPAHARDMETLIVAMAGKYSLQRLSVAEQHAAPITYHISWGHEA